jgi:hypothetical protein
MKGKENNGKGCEGTEEIRGTQGRVKTRGASVQYTQRHNTMVYTIKATVFFTKLLINLY